MLLTMYWKTHCIVSFTSASTRSDATYAQYFGGDGNAADPALDVAVTGGPVTELTAMDATTVEATAVESTATDGLALGGTMAEVTAMEGIVHVMPGEGDEEDSNGSQAESMEVDDGEQCVLTDAGGVMVLPERLVDGADDGKPIHTQRGLDQS